jgi:hypothetical protein
MINLSEGAAQVAAGDARCAVSDYDKAFASGLRLAATYVDTIDGAGVPIALSQRTYAAFSDSFAKLVDSRGSLMSVIRQMQIVHRSSNIKEMGMGCPDWKVFFTSGEADADMQPGDLCEVVSN